MNLKNIIYILMISVTVLSCEQADIWGDGNSAIDDVNPTITINPTSNTTIEVTFSENIKDDAHKTEANYSITEGLAISNFLVDSVNPLKVTLTVDSQIENNYSLTVNNIADLFENELSPNPRTFTADKLPEIQNVTSISDTEIEVTASEPIDFASATFSIKDNTNQELSIGGRAPGSTNRIVILTTANQTPDEIYTLTSQNYKDNHDNIGNVSTNTFTGYTGP